MCERKGAAAGLGSEASAGSEEMRGGPCPSPWPPSCAVKIVPHSPSPQFSDAWVAAPSLDTHHAREAPGLRAR